MYLVTACDKAFFIPTDDLQIAQVIDLSFDEYGAAVYGYGDFVVTESQSRTTVFDLRQCDGVPNESCVSKTWEGSVLRSVAVKGWAERFYGMPAIDPALLFISGKDTLTIYNLDTQQESVFEGQLGGVSEDGNMMLIVSTDSTYYLFDLRGWQAIDTGSVPNKHLIPARDWI